MKQLANYTLFFSYVKTSSDFMSNPCFLRSLGELLNLTNVQKVTFNSGESIPH